MDYIHLNPVRAGIVSPTQGLGLLDFPWSSLSGGYARSPAERPSWLETGRGFALFDCADTVRGRREFVERLERRRREEVAAECGVSVREGQSLQSTLRRGWYWGTQGVRERALSLLQGRTVTNRNYRSSAAGRSHDEAAALALLEAGLERAGLTESDLANLKGSDPRKVAIARVIHTQACVPQAWTAGKLRMGSATNVSQQLRRWRKESL